MVTREECAITTLSNRTRANRANAQKSTGPRSGQGRTRASLNRLARSRGTSFWSISIAIGYPLRSFGRVAWTIIVWPGNSAAAADYQVLYRIGTRPAQ